MISSAKNNVSFVFLLLIFSISVLSGTVWGQSKYLIFFTDKGFGKNVTEKELTKFYEKAKSSLSERCLERRLKSETKEILDLKDIPVSPLYINELKKHGIKIVHKLNWFNAVSAYLSEKQKEEIGRLDFVKKIRPVKIFIFKKIENQFEEMEKSVSSSSLDYGQSFAQLNFSDIPPLHEKGITGKGIRIGLMDSGFEWKEYKVFKKLKVVAEHDFVHNDDVTEDQSDDTYGQDQHGTEILSIIGGWDEGNLIGAAFGAEFVLAKTENIASETHAEEDNYAAALQWFENLGADISSSSLGYNLFDKGEGSYTYADMNGKTTIVTRAAEIAFQKGLLVITAAGNEASMPWHYIIAPADGFNTIAVGAMNSDGTIASFSSRGPTADGRIKPDLCALGTGVRAFDPMREGYRNVSGTSASTPIVAGGAALVMSAFPYLNNRQMRKILLETASNSRTPDNTIGYGKFSALKALNYPNIKFSSDSLFVVKYFLLPNDSLTDTPEMIIISPQTDIEGREKGNNRYEFPLPSSFENDSLKFYFSYSTTKAGKVRYPENDFFSYHYGDESVSHWTGNVIYKFPPKHLMLSQNFPNPFGAKEDYSTTVQFELPKKTNVKLEVYDVLGRKVLNVLNSFLDSGYYTQKIQLRNFASGVYFLILRTEYASETVKMLLIK